jgi:NAD(P)-dependent dehydrogenase (short-subunit alcohol dehydrogenase family)
MATVLITGANRGIGLELARGYAKRGDEVVACCRQPAKADQLAALAKANKQVKVQSLDVGDAKSIAALGKAMAGQTLDVVINNAGVQGPAMPQQSLLEMDYDGWLKAFEINSMAPLRVLQTLLPNLKASANGKVVTVTSQLGAMALDWPMGYAYCASKAAVNKVMRLAAVELQKQNVAVALVHPGWVRTDMGGPQADISPEESAQGIMTVIDDLSMANTGCFKKWNGEAHAW